MVTEDEPIDMSHGDTETRHVIVDGQDVIESYNDPISLTGRVLDAGIDHRHDLFVNARYRHADSTGEYHIQHCADPDCSYYALATQVAWSGY